MGVIGLIVPFIETEKTGKGRLGRRQENNEDNFRHVEIQVSVEYLSRNITLVPG